MTAEQRQRYVTLLRSRLSEQRFTHSINVAAQAVHLAELYGADKEKAELAGLLHDVMKETDGEEQLRYIRLLGSEPPPDLLAVPKLWHAVSGAAYLRFELGITDPDVLNSVRSHTAGRAGMSLLEQIIYLADYTSAERSYPDIEVIRGMVEDGHSLDDAMLYALCYTISANVRKGYLIYPDTLFAYNEILARSPRRAAD